MSPRAGIIAAVVVLFAGVIALVFWLSPHTPSATQIAPPSVQRMDGGRQTPLAVALAKKDHDALTVAARRIILAKVMHWRNQPSFKDGREPGDMAFPDACLAEAHADPKLAAWLASWYANLKQGKQASEQDRESLAVLLTGSALPCLALLDIGRAVDFLSEDRLTAARFYVAAGHAGATEAKASKDDPIRYRSILLGLDSTIDVLFRLIDTGHRDLVPDLKVICDTVAAWQPPGDPILDSECVWARIDAAECLYAQAKPEEALLITDRLSHERLSRAQKSGAAWADGFGLYWAGRYAESIPGLRVAAEDLESEHNFDAAHYLILALVRCKRPQEAEEHFNQFVRNSHPSRDEIRALWGEITAVPQ